MEVITGIYKITNPVGAIYIGESEDIDKRWNSDYKYLRCKTQRKLYNSFVKYGYENHTFEIIKECKAEEIPYYERHYQEFYNVLDREFGLNLKLRNVGDKKQVMSDESRKKQSETMKKKYADGYVNPKKGQKMSEEFCRKNSESKKGKTTWNKGIKPTESTIKKIIENHASKKEGYINPSSKKVINTETGEIYNSGSEMCKILGLNYSAMRKKLSDHQKNNTPFRYL